MEIDHRVPRNSTLTFPGCEGCSKKINHCSFSIYYNMKYMNLCPCKDCLVKSTCTITYCDERSKLYQESIDERKKYIPLNKEVSNE